MSAAQTLIERGRELDELRRALDEARGGRGRLVLIEGEAGIGKSSLLAAAREIAEAAGMRILSARATEIERDSPYVTARRLLEPALRSAPAERREAWLAGSAGPATSVLSIGPTSDAPPDPDVGTLHGLAWLLAGIAEDGPTLLLVDDVQWARS